MIAALRQVTLINARWDGWLTGWPGLQRLSQPSLSLLLLLSLSLWSLLLLLLIFPTAAHKVSPRNLPLLQKNAAAAGTQKKRQRLVRWRPLEAGEGCFSERRSL